KRGHRRRVQTGHENAVQVAVRFSTLEASAVVKVERLNRTVEVVGQGVRRRPIGPAFHAVTLPAFRVAEYLLPRLDTLFRYRGLRRNLQHRAGLFFGKARREMLDVG